MTVWFRKLIRSALHLASAVLAFRVHRVGSAELGRLGGNRGGATPLRGDRQKVCVLLSLSEYSLHSEQRVLGAPSITAVLGGTSDKL